MSNEPLDETLYEMDTDIDEQEAPVPVYEEPQAPWAQEQPYEDDEPQPAPEQAPSPVSGLDLDLTVRCGGVSLSLETLQHLAPGAVLGISGIAPGEATLCHGERVVAHGELVDVDGRLGLQITRVVFDR